MGILKTLLASAALATLAGAAQANTIYDNPFDFAAAFGDCSFSTTCAAVVGRGDDFAAQKFTIGSAAVISGGAFSELDLGTAPTDVTWGIIMADGSGGLPGTILAAGTDTINASTVLGGDGFYTFRQLFWDMGSVAIGPGSYYLAIQAISPVKETYLAEGVQHNGAAESHDSGVSWSSGYETIPGVSVALFGVGGGGAVPEPATWAMMLVGFGGIGLAARRRARTAAHAA